MDVKTVTAMIYYVDGDFTIRIKGYNLYNKYNVAIGDLCSAMAELTDVFNNALNARILFEYIV